MKSLKDANLSKSEPNTDIYLLAFTTLKRANG